MRTRERLGAAMIILLTASATAHAQAVLPPKKGAFTEFESGQVRPLALSADHGFLYAVNTPDSRLEILRVTAGGLTPVSSVVVGLEPVAVAVRGDTEVWVVNHLSDSISIVDVSQKNRPRVVRTLLVGDEPRDIVFAGPGGQRAFVTTAHRGQNSPIDPQLRTPGIGRADVWVFDAANLGAPLGGTPLTIVTLFCDTPRALAVTPDGRRVYAAGFHTGNRTTVVPEFAVPNGGEAAGGLPGPRTNFRGDPQPETGLIVKFDAGHWKDRLGRLWDSAVNFNLPDKDVFVIDAMASPPAQLAGAGGFYTSVGTILFDMVVNPANGAVYVANTDARNDVRFEGPGRFGGSTVRGHTVESRITVLAGSAVRPRHLNKHIDYDVCCAPNPGENAKSLAFPMGMAVTGDGRTLYVAAFGSSKIGVFDTRKLEDDTFVPSASTHIPVGGGGPSGLVLDEAAGRLYAMTRFDNAISVIDTAARREVAHLPLVNPEPESVIQGRPFLYDAARTSTHGDSACASCHVFGDFDSLAWDLGNPDADSTPNLNPIILLQGPFFFPSDDQFRTLKGPMTTQSLRGLDNHGPMHWRGDRTGAAPGVANAQPSSGAFDELAAFTAFNVAFESLLGRDRPLTDAEMKKFTAFILQVMYPPNPIRNLDNSLTPSQQIGRDRFFIPNTTFGFNSCNDCHTLDLQAKFFGTSGFTSFDSTNDPIDGRTPVKIPHLRNQYQKIGMFGSVDFDILGILQKGTPHLGDQVRGFGYTHDGSMTLSFFNSTAVFSGVLSPNGYQATLGPDRVLTPTPEGQATLDAVFDFMMAFDTNLAPVVGQQVTLTASSDGPAQKRVSLLEDRATRGECDLVAHIGGGAAELSYLFDGAGKYIPGQPGAARIDAAMLRLLAQVDPLTYFCAPPGSGARLAAPRATN